jgi:hypothetical protein
MKREDVVLFTFLALGSVAVPAALGAALGWPAWTWLLLVVVLLVATGVSARQAGYRRTQEQLRAEYAPPPPAPTPPPEVPVDEHRLMNQVTLPSAEADYRFLLSATVYWRAAPNPVGMRHTSPPALAMESIRLRAGKVTESKAPADYLAVQYQLAAALGTMLPDTTGQVVVWADNIVLSIPDDDAQRLHKLSALRKHEQIWEHERGFERNVRGYLSNEVLDSTGSAVVWWLARHTDDVEEAVRLIGPLAQLTAAANNTTVHELFQHLVATRTDERPEDTPALTSGPTGREGTELTSGTAGAAGTAGTTGTPRAQEGQHASGLADQVFTGDADDGRRRRFGHELASLVHDHGRPDVADRIRDVFGASERGASERGAATEGFAPVEVPTQPTHNGEPARHEFDR